ncbi:hypothetical protein [Streptococcus suis]|uniref:hypothetical protein n=1 Tax=Streptococcus suis TaxID=1307 RepID=UPI000C1A1207|nr:hypothetical protein [Streptococcus suis]
MKRFLIAVVIYTFSLAIGLVSVSWLVSDVFRTLFTLLFTSLLDIKLFKPLLNYNGIETFNHDKIEKRVTFIKFFYFMQAIYGIFINALFPKFAKYYSGLLLLELKIDTNPWLFIIAVFGPILALLVGYGWIFILSKSEPSKESKIKSTFQFAYTNTDVRTSGLNKICSTTALESLVQYYEQIKGSNFFSEWDDKGVRIFQNAQNVFLVEIKQELISSDFKKIELIDSFLVEFENEKVNKIQRLDTVC